jgi:D-glycero-beta-D-manno-heptose-7-phosphate kinase
MSKKPVLKEILEEFEHKKVLIIGDVMVDEYLWGNVTRISPEAPVPVVQCTKREHRMGGAANVAINVKALGAEPIMCSVIGKDDIGDIFKRLLVENQMSDAGILETDKRITTVKTRVIGNHQHLLRVDHEITDYLEPETEYLLIERIKKIILSQKIDALIFQDYDKGVLTHSLIEQVTFIALANKIPTLVDPKKRGFHHYSDITMFKPNFKELTEGLNISISKADHRAIFEASKRLQRESSMKNVMVTLSERGIFISDGTRYKVIPADIRDITDVSGAGDTVISVAALGLASGLSPFQSASLANLSGGLVCEKIGVVPIEPGLLLGEQFEFPEE